MRIRRAVLIIVLMVVLAAPGSVLSQTVPVRYFPLTGHTVRGEFLSFFDAHGGLAVLGYPITEEFVENGRLVQYFQRMRLDAYPENLEPYRVQPGPLGELLGRGEPPIPPSDIPAPNDPNRRYFPQTGHTVSYAFLNYFNARGGIEFFGYPITEFKYENGRIVQYFQRARLDWYPDLPPEQRVQLGNLGEVYAFERLSPDLLRPPPAILTQTSALEIVRLRPTATFKSAVTGRTGAQTLHVYVLDQLGRPVLNANVVAVVHFPSGDRSFSLPPTNGRGHTSLTFDLGQLQPGQRINVDVRVGFAALSAVTRASFLVWW